MHWLIAREGAAASLRVIAGLVIALITLLFIVVARGFESCTMGSTDRYMAGALVAVLGAVPTALLLAAGCRAGWFTFALAFVVGVSSIALLGAELLPWTVSVLYARSHPCGPEYDGYGVTPSERFYPLILTCAVVIIATGSLRVAWTRIASFVRP